MATLITNLRMIRRIAEIYGGRSGFFGSWRLTRLVFGNVIATGAVAIGDDLIGSVAGGSVLAKLSRKFGEGVINGALTARVGIAAMQLCRPLAFQAGASPSVTGIMKRALLGFSCRIGRAEVFSALWQTLCVKPVVQRRSGVYNRRKMERILIILRIISPAL